MGTKKLSGRPEEILDLGGGGGGREGGRCESVMEQFLIEGSGSI